MSKIDKKVLLITSLDLLIALISLILCKNKDLSTYIRWNAEKT